MTEHRPLVWVPTEIQPSALERLRTFAEVRLGYGPEAASFASVADEVQVILLRTISVDAAMMAAAPKLRLIARHGVGVDTVDLKAAEARGIRVTTTPAANTRSVAEHAIALLLAVWRNLGAALAGTPRSELRGRELQGRTLGLIGFGRIARQVAAIASAGFGMKVMVFDPHVPDAEVAAAGHEARDFVSLLRDADAVSVHVPLTPATQNLLSTAQFDLMRDGAVIINTSRGGLVDEEALLAALEAGQLGGAGLDVTSQEPLPDVHPLRARGDVVITPHIAAQTIDAMERVAEEAVDAIAEEFGVG